MKISWIHFRSVNQLKMNQNMNRISNHRLLYKLNRRLNELLIKIILRTLLNPIEMYSRNLKLSVSSAFCVLIEEK